MIRSLIVNPTVSRYRMYVSNDLLITVRRPLATSCGQLDTCQRGELVETNGLRHLLEIGCAHKMAGNKTLPSTIESTTHVGLNE